MSQPFYCRKKSKMNHLEYECDEELSPIKNALILFFSLPILSVIYIICGVVMLLAMPISPLILLYKSCKLKNKNPR